MDLLAAYAFVLGAVIGSFLNVVIYRLPLGISIVFPPSRCPSCSGRIRPWENIPILSFLLLRGKCSRCGVPISSRYVIVELANALFFLAIYLFTGPTVEFILLAAIVSMTLVLIFIDLDIQILPDVIDLPGIALGLALGFLHAGEHFPTLVLTTSPLDSLIGAAVGAGALLAVALTYKLIRGIEGMGLGDVKMLAMIGATTGWRPLLPVLLFASVTGAIVGVGIAIRQRTNLQYALPFGVFLGLSLLFTIFFGQKTMDLYSSLFTG